MDYEDLAGSVTESAKTEQANGAWLIIFTDLLSLLLTFFVLMFSMNAVQVADWQAVVDTLSDRLNTKHALISAKEWDGYESTKVEVPLAHKIEYLHTVINEKLGNDPVLKNSHMQLLNDRLIISLPSDMLFGKGSSMFSNAGAQNTIEELANILGTVTNQLAVSAHSDPPPVVDEDFSSNWELSLIRAVAVSRIITDSGYSHPIMTFGNGDAMIEELGLGLNFEQKSRLARRVDIIVKESDARDLSE